MSLPLRPPASLLQALLVMMISLLMTACGGGGDSNNLTDPPAQTGKAPVIITHPASQATVVDTPVTFTVAAEGDNLTFQWFRNGDAVDGANANSYTLTSPQLDDHNSLWTVRVRNTDGSVTSSAAILTVTEVPLLPPVITSAPASQTVREGDPVTFTVTVASDLPVTYQWQRNTANVSGATSDSYSLEAAVDDNGSQWRVIVTNAAGSVTSAIATLTVTSGLSAEADISVYAGQLKSAGNDDGTPGRFTQPAGLLRVADGTLYVTDASSHVIRRISTARDVSTLAGAAGISGDADGNTIGARFNGPGGITIDSSGNLFVADQSNHTIRKITPTGDVSLFAGFPGGSGTTNGTGTGARFNMPTGIAIDSGDNLYVTDMSNHTVRKITPAGVVTTLAGVATAPGTSDGTGSEARFCTPQGIVADADDNLYVADACSHTLRKITPGGTVTTIAGQAGSPGAVDGDSATSRLSSPAGLAIDSLGNLYVTDRGNSLIRKLLVGGDLVTIAGAQGATAVTLGEGGSLHQPLGIAWDADTGVLYTTGDNAILLVTP